MPERGVSASELIGYHPNKQLGLVATLEPPPETAKLGSYLPRFCVQFLIHSTIFFPERPMKAKAPSGYVARPPVNEPEMRTEGTPGCDRRYCAAAPRPRQPQPELCGGHREMRSNRDSFLSRSGIDLPFDPSRIVAGDRFKQRDDLPTA